MSMTMGSPPAVPRMRTCMTEVRCWRMSVPTPLTTDSLAAEMDTYPIAPEALIWVGSKTVRPGWWLVVLRLGASGSAMF